MSKAQKIAKKLNDSFVETFNYAFEYEFGVSVTTEFSIFNMALVSRRADGEKLTRKQKSWSTGYSEGYAAAMNRVGEM